MPTICSPKKFITANLICGVTFALLNPTCKNHMLHIADIRHPFPFRSSLTCVLQYPSQLEALEIKYRCGVLQAFSTDYIQILFWHYHWVDSLLPPSSDTPLCHACLAPLVDMQQNLLFQKEKKGIPVRWQQEITQQLLHIMVKFSKITLYISVRKTEKCGTWKYFTETVFL